MTSVLGSPGNDTIIGTTASTSQTLQGGAPSVPNPNAVAAKPPNGVPTQWVYLDFNNTPTPIPGDTGEVLNSYSATDQASVFADLAKIYTQFDGTGSFLQFVTAPPTAAEAPNGYVTINYDSTPVFNTDLASGGVSAVATASFSSSGAVTGFNLTSGGSGYTSAPTVTLMGGGGTGAPPRPAVITGGRGHRDRHHQRWLRLHVAADGDLRHALAGRVLERGRLR